MITNLRFTVLTAPRYTLPMPKLTGLAALAVLAACGGSKKEDTTPKAEASKADASLCETKDKRVESFDLNKDGKPDVWRVYGGKPEHLECKQVDFDHDGRKDWLEAYNVKGVALYQKADFDYDGKFDMLKVLAGERVVEVERDTDFDGKFDVKEVYDANGQLTNVRRDRNGDNKPDQWENYNGATLVSTSYDDNFDGKVDRNETAAQADANKQ